MPLPVHKEARRSADPFFQDHAFIISMLTQFFETVKFFAQFFRHFNGLFYSCQYHQESPRKWNDASCVSGKAGGRFPHVRNACQAADNFSGYEQAGSRGDKGDAGGNGTLLGFAAMGN